MIQSKRIVWVDYTKLFACILVVLGHFFQSMTASNILPDNSLYQFFNTTIYYFHVPLFFICSGFLYQQYSKINCFGLWKNNILKKLLSLGIPYLVFSTITWSLKNLFSGSVNIGLESGLLKTLFLQPISPYWYLYALFFIFLVTPTFTTKKQMWLIFIISIVLKVITFFVTCKINCVEYIMEYSVWFVMGMIFSKIKITNIIGRKDYYFGIIFGVSFFILSVLVFNIHFDKTYIGFLLGFIACISVIWLCISLGSSNDTMLTRFSARYTMPIYLMHTIFAAPLRIVLTKIGITNWVMHTILGLAISFVGPIIAEMIMCRFKFLEFFLYPNKVLKGRKKICQQKN